MSGEYIPAEALSAGEGRLPDNFDCLACRIDQCVERWNHWSRVSQRSDAENYLNGDIKFAFEYMCGRGSNSSELIARDILGLPNHIATVFAESAAEIQQREIGDLASNDITGKPCIISRWDQKPVFIEKISLMDEVEKFVPSVFTVGPQAIEGAIKSHTCPMGVSVLHGYLKPYPGLGKGELDFLSPPFVDHNGRNDIPVGMIECGSEIVNNIPTDQGCFVYDGFVLFGERGALAGLCICFNTIGERTIFAEQFAKISDVFRGSINL